MIISDGSHLRSGFKYGDSCGSKNPTGQWLKF